MFEDFGFQLSLFRKKLIETTKKLMIVAHVRRFRLSTFTFSKKTDRNYQKTNDRCSCSKISAFNFHSFSKKKLIETTRKLMIVAHVRYSKLFSVNTCSILLIERSVESANYPESISTTGLGLPLSFLIDEK